MLKIKDKLMKKIYSSNLTRFELITMIELIKISNDEGITNIYYKELIESVGCNTSTFYNVLNSLENKGFLEHYKNEECSREIKVGINGNYFVDNYNEYVNINNVLICDNIYKNLSAGEIRTMLYFLLRVKKQKYTDNINDKKNHEKNKLYYREGESYKIIARRLNVTVRMVKKYIKGLIEKKVISFGEKINTEKTKKMDIVTFLKEVLKTASYVVSERGKEVKKNITDKQLHYVNCIKNICRRNKVKIADKQNLDNTALLMIQYSKKAEESKTNIYRAIANAVRNLKANVLDSKIIHCILKMFIRSHENHESIVIY